LINSEDDAVDIFSAASTFLRRNLQRTEGYFEHALPGYSLDEFTSHFRMSRGTMEGLCRVVQATGSVPQRHSFRRPPIPLQKQVLAFVWFISNSEVFRSVSDRFNVHWQKSFEQARISTYHFYMQHIRAAINFLDLVLERGRQSTHSSPQSLFAKSFQKTDPDQPPFLLKHEGAKGVLAA